MELSTLNITILILLGVAIVAILLGTILWQRSQILNYKQGKKYGFLGKPLPVFLLFLAFGVGAVGISNLNSPTSTSANNQLSTQVLYSNEGDEVNLSFNAYLNNVKLLSGQIDAYWTITATDNSKIIFSQPDTSLANPVIYKPNLRPGSYKVNLMLLYLDLQTTSEVNIVVN